MSYCPITCCPSAPSTVPTCAPRSSGESCSNIPPMARISSGTSGPSASRVASPIAVAILAAAGSTRSRRLWVFALTQSARRTVRISTTSVGASRPVKRATCISATRTDSSKPRRSSSVGAGSSRPSCAFAMPIWRAISQFTGPDDDDMTRWSSRKSGASANASGSPDPNGKSMHPGYDPARARMRRVSDRRCSFASVPIRSPWTRPWRGSPTTARAAPACSSEPSGTTRAPGDVSGLRYEAWDELADAAAPRDRRRAVRHVADPQGGDPPSHGRPVRGRGERRDRGARRRTGATRSTPVVRGSSA